MDHQGLSFATIQPSTCLGTSDVKQGDSLQRPSVIFCFGYEHKVFEGEEKRFFCLFYIKTYSQKKNGSKDLIFTSSSDLEYSKVNFIADYVLEVEGLPNSSNQDERIRTKNLKHTLMCH